MGRGRGYEARRAPRRGDHRRFGADAGLALRARARGACLIVAALATLAGALSGSPLGVPLAHAEFHEIVEPQSGRCHISHGRVRPLGEEFEGEVWPTGLQFESTFQRHQFNLPRAHYVRCNETIPNPPIHHCQDKGNTRCVSEPYEGNWEFVLRRFSIPTRLFHDLHYWPCGEHESEDPRSCEQVDEDREEYAKRYKKLGPTRRNHYGAHNGSTLAPPDCHAAHPVDCATGNLTESQTDLSVGGRGVPLTLTRTYNSQAASEESAPGPFGYGWSASFLDHLEFHSEAHALEGAPETVTVVQADGSTANFSGSPTTPGLLTPARWVEATLKVENDGTFLYTLPDQEHFHFDKSGRLLSESDRYGNTTSLSYNESGQLSAVKDSVNRELTFTYYTAGEATGRVKTVSDPMHNTVEYGYGSGPEAGDLTSIKEPGEANPRWRFTYDSSHRMKTETDGRGGTTTNEYNANNQVEWQEDPMHRKTTFKYETVGPPEVFEGSTWIAQESREEEELAELGAEEETELVNVENEYGAEVPAKPPEYQTTITSPTGAVTLEHFNSEDELTSITRGYGSGHEAESTEELGGYNSAEEPGFRIDGNNHKTDYTYDAEGNLEKETDALGHTTTWHYDHLHDVISEETPNGHTTSIKRNEKTGAAEEVKRPAPNGQEEVTKYTYGTAGEVKAATIVLGLNNERTWTYEYNEQVDPYGDRTAEKDPEGDKRTFAYNADSQLVSTTVPSGNAPKAAPLPATRTIERDAQGRPVAVIEPPEGFLMKSSLPPNFGSVSAVAVNSEGDVWVGRLSSGAVEEFSKTGELIRALPSTFEHEGEHCKGSLAETVGLAVDAHNRLWVTDRKGNRVLRFSAEGKCELEVGPELPTELQFNQPQGIAVANGYVWVLDSGNGRVERFVEESGAYSNEKFSSGRSSANPWGIAVDSKGHVWISQMLGYEALREYTESGQFVRTVRSPNSGNEYSWGTGLSPSPGGGVYIAYWNGARVDRYGPEGEYLQRVGSCCEGTGHFQWATGLAMAPDGSLWLSEQRYGRVEHWEAFASKTTYTYDDNGNLETVTNPDGHTTTYKYNEDNELEDVIEPNGAEQKSEYDGAGQVTAQIDGNGHATKYERNALEEVKEVIDPRSRTTVKKYDGAGNLKSVTYPGSSEPNVEYAYDAANQLKTIAYPRSTTPTVTYEYDKDGNRTEMKDGTGTTAYTYDQLDRLERVEDERANSGPIEVVKYGYDLANELTKLTYPNGKEVERGYDKAGRLTSVKDWLGNTTSFTYNEDSAPTGTIFPAATGEEDKYFNDGADRTSEVSFRKGSTTLASVAYSRDPEGNVTTTVTSGLPEEETAEYTYDKNGRLASAGPSGSTTTYEYDLANNSTKFGSTTQHFGEADELKESGATKNEYNELGERTEAIPSSGPRTTYTYDQAEELTSVSRSEGPPINDSYTYNGEGLRSSQKVSGVTTYLSWNEAEGLPVLLTDGVNSFVYGPEGLPVEQVSSGGTVTYLHHDQAGSTRLITGEAGEILGSYSYGPYGETTGRTGTATTPLGYDGEYTNSDTGLIYLRNRIYDPSTGQFMSVDPLEPLTRERYSYATDSPLNYDDPAGLEGEETGGGGVPSPWEIVVGGVHATGEVLVGGTKALGEGWKYDVEPVIAYPFEKAGEAYYGVEQPQIITRQESKEGCGSRHKSGAEALIGLAKRAKKTGGVSREEAETLREWAQEYKQPFEWHEGHPLPRGKNPASQNPHIRVGRTNHIPVR
jgi:RHS repeat-associated protein